MRKREPLEYYIHDGPEAVRFELVGSLSGRGAESAHQAWQTALSTAEDRAPIIDITFVVEADERGRALLLLWHQHGARIIAASRESQGIIKHILDEPAVRASGHEE